MRTLLVIALIAAALPAAEAKKGKKSEQAARKQFERGAKLFQKKQYEEAIRAFDAAYDEDPRPEYLYTKGQAERLGGDCQAAIATYTRYLDTKEKKYAPHARENIKRCKEEVEAQKPLPPVEPVRAEPEPQPEAKEPPPKPAVEQAPEPTPPQPPAPAEQATPPPAEPAPAIIPEAPSQTPFYSDWTGNALTAGGLVVGAVGAFLWMQGRSAADDANGAADLDAYRDAAEGAETRQWIGVACMGAGGALVAGGIIHYATRPSAREPAVSFVPARGGGAVVLGGRF